MTKFKWSVLGLMLLICQMMMGQESIVTDTVPFELTSHNNISIKALLNDSDTVSLMFHTAASSLTITEKAAKDLSSINWGGEEEVGSWGGKTEARYSAFNSLRINDMIWDSLAIWENENSGPTTDGKFGPNLFDGYILEINFDQSILILHQALPLYAEEYQKMNLLIEDDLMFMEGTSNIGGKTFKNRFLIHSGYGGTVLYDDQFAEESEIGKQIEILEENELRDSYGNVLKTKKGKLPEFLIGEIQFEDLPVGFFEGSIGRQKVSVIGGDLLKRLNLIIDAKRGYIYVQPNQIKGLAYTGFSKG